MKFVSTRSNGPISLSSAINNGLADDGGLFIPQSFEKIDVTGNSYVEIATSLLKSFFKDDPLSKYLHSICDRAFNFPCPLNKITDDLHHLELFHGPTAAFKDFGARFLAQCYSHLPGERIILVATSGDTGGAVASAFDGVTNTKVIILYPKNGVSPLQEHQLTCWGDNILSLRVDGSFDDCQRMVKEVFSDSKTKNEFNLTSANSINIGRLLPQMTYYAYSSLHYQKETGAHPNYIIPTGNMGNAMACFWAKACGMPIGEIILTTNANDVIPKAITTGELSAKKSVKTLANAMDVGTPSNFERFKIFQDQYPDISCRSYAVDDEMIKSSMINAHQNFDLTLCPHTATAYHIWETRKIENAIMVGTAHPSKFQEVSSSVGIKTQLHDSLQKIFSNKTSTTDINCAGNTLLREITLFSNRGRSK